MRVEGVTTTAQIGSRQARPGHEFVIVDTSWKNVIPLKAVDKSANASPVGGLSGFGTSKRPPPEPKDTVMMPTPFVVPMLRKQFWLFTDGRFADTVDLEAQAATADAFPAGGFTVEKLGDVVRGKLVFDAPAGARHRAFQFYDNNHGHALIAVGGKAAAPPPAAGPVRENELMELVLAEAAFSPAESTHAGRRYYTVSLRGTSRSPTDVVDIQPLQFVFAQNEHGCVSQPERNAPGLTRPMIETGSFPPTSPNEGQMAFLVPDDSERLRVLVVPSRGGGIVLAAGSDFTPSWPAPQHTIQDGSTMKLHVLGLAQKPAGLAAGGDREIVVLDFVAENLKANQGIDLQGTLQLRLVDPAGAGYIQPSPLSNEIACALAETGVIPAGHVRRFRYVYDIPAGAPIRLQYRGFERDEAVVEIRR